MKRDWLFIVSVPLIYVVGIVLFFTILPHEITTLMNFVVYGSSLSTIVMVLVYIFTTSQQLRTMRKQLDEMQYSRDVQVQPLLFFDKLKMHMDAPRFYLGPETRFKKAEFMCRIHFGFDIMNIGNGPAVAVDFIPTLGTLVQKDDKVAKLLDYEYDERIECLSLKREDTKDISLMFLDEKHRFIELVMSGDVVLHLLVVFKNVLGMPFKEEITFRIYAFEPSLREKLKSCLKTVRTVEIDFAEDIREFESLRTLGKDEEATDKFKKMGAKLKTQLGGLAEIRMSTDILSGSFSIVPISKSEYKDIITLKKITIAEKAPDSI